MSRLLAVARFALAEFGPLIVFWTLAATLGVKPAILGSILFIVADAAWRWRKRLKFTRLYLLTSALTLVFGLVDLASTSPFMLKYEAVITNVATALAFVAGAMGEKPIVQEAAEQRGETFVATNEIRAFFRLFTLVWAAYFFLKAALFAWMAWTMPMLEAMALRSVAGGVSLGLMIAVSVTQGRRLFFLCRRLGLLPKPDEPTAGAGALPASPYMTIRSDEAAAMLADVESVVAKVKQSRIYRNAALIFILWGVVDLVRDLLIWARPAWFGSQWFWVDLAGVVGTLAILRLGDMAVSHFPIRTLAAFALFYVFGWIWSNLLGQFGPRESMAFWPTLFMFGYAIVGLWFGWAFTAIGLGLTALVLAGYFWSGDGFILWQAIVTGFGFMLCGLWMRRA